MNSGKACRRTPGELLQTVASSCTTFMGKFSSGISNEASITRKPGDFFWIGPRGKILHKKTTVYSWCRIREYRMPEVDRREIS